LLSAVVPSSGSVVAQQLGELLNLSMIGIREPALRPEKGVFGFDTELHPSNYDGIASA
jgi:hypothetical protein